MDVENEGSNTYVRGGEYKVVSVPYAPFHCKAKIALERKVCLKNPLPPNIKTCDWLLRFYNIRSELTLMCDEMHLLTNLYTGVQLKIIPEIPLENFNNVNPIFFKVATKGKRQTGKIHLSHQNCFHA